MLDAYIIDQLQRERERVRDSYIPLRIEPPRPPLPMHPPQAEEEKTDDHPQHGVVIIDYFSDPDD